jgi:outer membrane protein insertion porin family
VRRVGTGTAGVLLIASLMARAQSVSAGPEASPARVNSAAAVAGAPATVWQWKGLRVDALRFEGVTFDSKDKLLLTLAQKAGEPLDPAKVRDSMRRLFASGRYRDISVRGVREGDGATLIFAGTPRYFVGRVTIAGVKDERLASLLEFATNLNPGTAFTDDAVPAGTTGITDSLKQAGYYQPQVSVKTTIDEAGGQEDVVYTVVLGPQARIGDVTLAGNDPGMTVEEFRKKGKLKANSKISRDTTSNALSRLRTQYQKKDHLEATVTLQSQTYDSGRKQVDYGFNANQGPEVQVEVEGAKVSKSRLHLLVPIFEEGTIDSDLLNEGLYNLREYMEQQGYFDAKATVKVTGAEKSAEKVVFSIDKGVKHKVLSVGLKGNKYFQDDLLKDRLKVQKTDAYQKSGRYSQSLLAADVSSIQALYRANGFDETQVTPEVKDVDKNDSGGDLKVGQIRVTYSIVEGPQQKFGAVQLAGVEDGRVKAVTALLNAQTGQPYSLLTLSGDRDAVLGYYLSNGFDQSRVEIKQVKESADSSKTDVTLSVTEGPQVTIDKVLLSGVEHTRTSVIEKQVKVKAGDPLNQSALLETQRNLYNLALFNEAVAAVQNPQGEAPSKNVILQVTEAKRWDVTYGFGFEAQTGTPQSGTISEASCIQLMLNPCNQLTQDGKTGVSPRVSADITRINLRGTQDSLTLHTTYGLLEKVATLSFTNPHFRGYKNLAGSITGGYSDVQNITTFAASTLQGDLRLTQKLHRTDTVIYDFLYRRVAVDPNSLQVSANLIPLLSQPVRVGGPGITWFHDTRQPGPLDASKGSYTSVQEFAASSKFGSQTSFNRLDMSNSTYYEFGKRKYVLARNTRGAFETEFGKNPNIGNAACLGVLLTTNPSCTAVPLPERLYAGGASSQRGFGINAAGPRDLQTGFPVGGTAAFVNTVELRMPAATLPYVGDNISFVLFHDMGNVFQNGKDLFPSFKRVHQPNASSCNNVSGSIGTCSFDYFSHDVGLGIRYKTPVGPVRVDFSYNLNPPKYPVIFDFNGSNPYVGQAPHFNFFFSIGQSF